MSFIACRYASASKPHPRIDPRKATRLLKWLPLVALLALTACDHAKPENPSPKPVASQPVTVASKPESTGEMTPKQMYVAYCSACHTLELVESQRLDRTNWEWVMDDVINEYGGTWITEQERKTLVDYLVENFGPEGESVETAP